MINGLSQTKQYLHEVLSVDINPIQWRGVKKLPSYLRNLYTYYEIMLLENRFLLMYDSNEQEHSPAIIQNHINKLRDKWNGEVVYARSRMTSYNRKRLIKHKVPFVVPGNQLYLPMLGIDLREHFRKLRTKIPKFSPSTQALVIHVLLQENLNRIFTPTEMSVNLGYSAMTMTRAFDELEFTDLGDIFPEGRERYIRFFDLAKETWAKAQKYFRSPVKMRHYINLFRANPTGPSAGLTALADYSLLAMPDNPIIALSKEEWKLLKQNPKVNEIPSSEPGAMEIEVWNYPPSLFAKNMVVDKLSLYLSLKSNQDERVEAALEEMMGELKW